MRITKGVIAAAGKGTRFLPMVKAMPKEMLPIVDKPIIQYIVEEFVAAGIKDIVIVTSWDHRPIEDHFDHTFELEAHLKRTGKLDKLREVRRIAELANFIYVRQKGPYGNGTPCLNAESVIGKEPFVYAFGDDLVLAKESFTKTMLKAFAKRPGLYLGVQEVPAAEVVKYGIIEPLQGQEKNQVSSVVEKPAAGKAPSRLAVFGRYILLPEIFAALREIPLGKGRELWLADGIHHLIKNGQKVYYKKVESGRWYTTGDPVTYLEAVRAFALSRTDLDYQDSVRKIFR